MSEYIVVARKTPKADWEPVHPGHTSREDAHRVVGSLLASGVSARSWPVEKWNAYELGLAGGICDACGEYGCNCTC